MSDEEKKAIEYLKQNNIVEIQYDNYGLESIHRVGIDEKQIILNLIEKQSKEIEELKKPKYVINCKTNEITKLTNDFVSKDKIKEILGIEEKIDNEKLLSLLQTIVDENSRLEDIEDRKVQIEYNNVFNRGVKSVEDKIKAKIEEVKDGTFDAKIVLQSLLEKE